MCQATTLVISYTPLSFLIKPPVYIFFGQLLFLRSLTYF